MHMVKFSDPSKRYAIIGDVARLVDLFGIYMRPFAEPLIATLREHWLPVAEVKSRS